MSVEISGVTGRAAQSTGDSGQAASVENKVANSQTQPTNSPNVGGDSVKLTDTATKLQQLTATVAAMPVVDVQRVSDVQRAVGTGSFQFEPATAADNLVTQERELALLDISK
ncbi:MAG: flagellar biosynthesis anti-sigma factor FlgM [Sedimenticola sp.]|jgi:flagellar biosynthesis anti-sigma factor FlgM|nr:MAG: flagellar biosynthesis anti-sigma factor FlgM [Sedimenticola sp.]